MLAFKFPARRHLGLHDVTALSLKPRPNDCNMPTQHLATLLGATCCVRLATVLRHVGCCWLKFENGQIWASNTQHLATCGNTVANRTQYVAPNSVAMCCVGLLRSFDKEDWHGITKNEIEKFRLNFSNRLTMAVLLYTIISEARDFYFYKHSIVFIAHH